MGGKGCQATAFPFFFFSGRKRKKNRSVASHSWSPYPPGRRKHVWLGPIWSSPSTTSFSITSSARNAHSHFIIAQKVISTIFFCKSSRFTLLGPMWSSPSQPQIAHKIFRRRCVETCEKDLFFLCTRLLPGGPYVKKDHCRRRSTSIHLRKK